MIEKANRAGKPVITATQMLDSMERNPRPTRAEASDVANAIFDGTDAIMLSGETAAGKYPIQAVETMARIAERAERALRENIVPAKKRLWDDDHTITGALSQAVASIAKDLRAKAIVTPTASGHTARMVSKYRPESIIIAVTPHEEVARRLLLSQGVYPVVVQQTATTDEMLEAAVEGALRSGFVKHGDLVVITAGVPVGQPGTTNLLKVHTISDVLVRGQGIGHKAVTGRVVKGKYADEVLNRIHRGDILVMTSTDADVVPAMELAGAVIVEEGGLTSHAAVVGLSLGIPVIVGAEDAMTLLEDGEIVTVDPGPGLIYKGQVHVL
jgi:pyruvate kinase